MKPVARDEDAAADCDIFGTGRRIGGGQCSARARPSMISAKYRLKEERRKVLKISVAKLRRIDDPESSLRRSVLINNTVRRLQREARDEKLLRPGASSHLLGFEPTDPDFPVPKGHRIPCLADASLVSCLDELATSDDREEEDVHSVLSQFYMPPTPRMLTTIDEEDTPPCGEVARRRPQPCVDGSAELGESDVKRPRVEDCRQPRQRRPEELSCGHASMFGELQSSVVFHSLIASLES